MRSGASRQPASSVLRGFQPALLLFHAPDFGLGLADRSGNLTRLALSGLASSHGGAVTSAPRGTNPGALNASKVYLDAATCVSDHKSSRRDRKSTRLNS